MQMPGRLFSNGGKYRYGFNGQENSDEIAAGLTTAMYWEYDSRIGRRWNADPIINPSVSPYACFDGNPILMSDPNGDQPGGPGDEVNPNNEKLILPARAIVLSRLNGGGQTADNGATVNAPNGSVNQFSIDGKVFDAMYDKDGKFTRYADANDTKKNYELSDYFDIQQNDIGFWGRAGGFVQGLGGVLEMAGGATIGGGTAWTGVGALAGGAIMVHGADNAVAGFMTAFTGCPSLTLTEKAVMLTGASGGTASLVNAGLSLASGTAVARFNTGLWNPMSTMVEKNVEIVASTVSNAGEILSNFGIPKLYTYTNGGKSVFVSPHAMKHLEELAVNGAKLGPDYLKLLGQTYQRSLHAAIDDVLSQGAINFRQMYYSGGNEIMFAAPRNAGQLPAVIHFR